MLKIYVVISTYTTCTCIFCNLHPLRQVMHGDICVSAKEEVMK